MEDIMKLLKEVEVDPEYDITVDDYKVIYENSRDNHLLLIYNGFLAGYMQGKKEVREKSK